MSAPGDEIDGDECAVMSPPMMSCPVTTILTLFTLTQIAPGCTVQIHFDDLPLAVESQLEAVLKVDAGHPGLGYEGGLILPLDHPVASGILALKSRPHVVK